MIRKFIWAVIKLAKQFLEELMRGWFKRKFRTAMLYAAALMVVLIILITLAAIL